MTDGERLYGARLDGWLDKDAVMALAGRICASASQQAVAPCQLLELIGELDAGGRLGHLSGMKSVAHWIAYSCSMAPGVAREHVRVARAMRRMPTVTAAFRAPPAFRLIRGTGDGMTAVSGRLPADEVARPIAGARADGSPDPDSMRALPTAATNDLSSRADLGTAPGRPLLRDHRPEH